MKAKEKNFEKELPEGYQQTYHINAKSAKIGLIFNLAALLVLILVMLAAFLIVDPSQAWEFIQNEPFKAYLYLLAVFVGMLLYMVLHELVHGAAYKSLTGQKLTFGVSWSCAFCGVPEIYVYRKAALIALVAPFAVFSVIFLALMAIFVSSQPLLFLIFAFLFGLHFGGCSGDLYMLGLLLFKYKDETLLLRDTGPEQFIYIKE